MRKWKGQKGMSTAKQFIMDGLCNISDDIQDEFEILEGLYKIVKLEQSRKSVKEEGTLSSEEVRSFFAEKQKCKGIFV